VEQGKQIKHVAIYLRKSRDDGETDDVLMKHRETLVNYAQERNWTYIVYEEVASGESILKRQEMRRLLNDVSDEQYDGVLVMDVDRLSRGRNADVGLIEEAFRETGTFIITIGRVYDWNDEADEMLLNFMLLGSRLEYRQIVKRLKRGKLAGAKKGMWVNGKPPFPYYYDRLTKSIKVDENKRYYYRMMVEKFLSGSTLAEITRWISANMPTPYGIKTDKNWSFMTIERVLANEVHLGYVVCGKSHCKDKNNRKYLPKEEWKRYKGTHKALKTQEEHAAILEKLAKNKLKHPKNKAGTLPFSGLLYCQQCGRRMSVCAFVENGVQKYKTRCENRYDKSICCGQRSTILSNEFYNAIYAKIVRLEPKYLLQLQQNSSDIEYLKSVLQIKRKEVSKHQQALERLYELYEENEITKAAFHERKAARENQLNAAENEIIDIEAQITQKSDLPTMETIQERIDYFRQKWRFDLGIKERNRLIETMVEKIMYNRVENSISLQIQYN